jgi:hypothetical protein
VTGSTTQVSISPNIGPYTGSGAFSIQPVSTQQYILTATNTAGSVTANLRVDVKIPQPPAITFTAESTHLKRGQRTTLHWNVSASSSVSLEPQIGAVNASGEHIIHPMESTEYTLSATGPGGPSQSTVTIEVNGDAGASSGQLIWDGNVSGTQFVTIQGDHADIGSLQGALPGVICSIQPENEKKVGIVEAPGPANDYARLVLRVSGKGQTHVVVDWSTTR